MKKSAILLAALATPAIIFPALAASPATSPVDSSHPSPANQSPASPVDSSHPSPANQSATSPVESRPVGAVLQTAPSAAPVFGAGIALPAVTLLPAVALPGWSFRGASGGLDADAEGWRTFKMRTTNLDNAPVFNGRAHFAEAPGGAIRAEWRVTPSADANVLETVVAGNIPGIAGGSALLDGKSIPIAIDGAKPHIFKGFVTNFSLLLKNGETIFRCAFDRPTQILLQDSAVWGGMHLTLRIYFAEGPVKGGTEYAIDATFLAPDAGPLALGKGDAITINAGPDWIPLSYDPWIEQGSALDFSTVLPHHAPAGKFGRVIAVGDHFEFENLPGVPQRFYGVNLCGTANLPSSREAADRFAANIARIGYNSLRIHHHERNLIVEGGNWHEGQDDTTPSPEQWEKFDNLVAACVENGLYLTTDLFVSRSHLIPWRSIGIDRDGCISNTGHFKVLCAFWEPAYSNLCAWTRNFLGHVNPRTGRSLAEEPALATLALINEGNLGNWGGAFLRDLPGVAEAWGKPIPDDCNDPEFAIFLAERETALFERLKAFVRNECGCKAPLSSLSCWYNPPQYQLVRTHFDYVDDHFYVDHPIFLDKSWSLPSKCANVNPVAGASGGARDVEWRRLMDKPFCLTEWNYSAPGRFRGVGGIATGALGALQNWSGMWRFAWSHGRGGIEHPGGSIGYFDMNSDPLGLAAERAALCLFLRRDIAPLEEERPAVLDAADLLDPAKDYGRFPGPQQPLSLGWSARVGTIVKGASLPLPDSPTSCPDSRAQSRVSTSTPDGSFMLDTPRTAGGFAESGVHQAGPIKFQILPLNQSSANPSSTPATVWASSLDGEPIASSSRILVTHLTDIQNSGIKYGDPGLTILLAWGSRPHLAHRGRAEIELSLAPGATPAVYRLATNGHRLGTVTSSFDSATGRLTFIADTAIDPAAATLLYEITR
ncbi:MAG: hypothetical protein ILM98_11415 [Kiritimatiellae bacterium]|nr:hypothetical protein [Kiritimatiellia bacterium]